MPAAVLHGRAFWPGVQGVLSAQYTVSHGTSPGLAHLALLPQEAEIAVSGNLVLTDGETTITIPRCKVDRLDTSRDGSGQTWHLSILDRRWQWREAAGFVSGWYNQPDPHGFLLPWTIRTPRQLLELCLLAMGEQGYTILAPNSFFPPVSWDYCNPAAALSQLCEQLGCRVVYRLDTDSVLIVPLGNPGPDLPEGSLYAEGPSLDSPEAPDSILLVGAPTRYQGRFKLEAVGKDWDGLYRPLNALSYRPVNGWESCGPSTYAQVVATPRLTYLQSIDLARESVYRCYRLINLNADGTGNALDVPGYGTIQRREQVLLESTKVEQVQPAAPDERIADADGVKLIKHFYDGFRRDVPAECYGAFNLAQRRKREDADVDEAQNTDPLKKIPIAFSIDPILQIVTFSQPVYVISPVGNKITVPDIILETACTIRHPVTNHVERFTRELSLGGTQGTGSQVILHEDVAHNVIGEYEVKETDPVHRLATHRLTGLRLTSALGFSVADTIRRADYYLRAAAAKYQLVGGIQRTYNGLMPLWLDGRIQQVTWHIGEPDGAYTQVSQNTEHSWVVPPYPQRLRAEFAPPVPGKQAQPQGVKAVLRPQGGV